MDAKEIQELFKSKGKTLGAAESFTGGLFAHDITKVGGASSFFKGSLVTYATEEKNRILGISLDDINKYGVVSQEIAGQMAMHAMSLLNVDYAVAFTGNAGPTAMEDKPVGEIYIAVSFAAMCRVYKYNLTGTREQIQRQAVNTAYKILEITINEFN